VVAVIAPVRLTGKPVSQVPVSAIVDFVGVLTAGPVITTAGPTDISTKLRLSVPIFPAASVCAATTFFVPSGEDKVTVAANCPFEHVAVAAVIAPERLTGNPLSQVPVKAMVDFVGVLTAGPVITTAGPTDIKTKLRLSEPTLPAASVCVATTFFVPSGEVRVTVAANCPFEHVAVVAEIAPERLTVSPLSQVPVKAMVDFVGVLTAGPVITTAGPTDIRIKLRLSVPTLPAASVCVATTFLVPSGAVNVTVAANCPFEHVAVAEVIAPERLTGSPLSQVPVKAMVDFVGVLTAGPVITTAGPTDMRIKLRLSVPTLPAASV